MIESVADVSVRSTLNDDTSTTNRMSNRRESMENNNRNLLSSNDDAEEEEPDLFNEPKKENKGGDNDNNKNVAAEAATVTEKGKSAIGAATGGASASVDDLLGPTKNANTDSLLGSKNDVKPSSVTNEDSLLGSKDAVDEQEEALVEGTAAIEQRRNRSKRGDALMGNMSEITNTTRTATKTVLSATTLIRRTRDPTSNIEDEEEYLCVIRKEEGFGSTMDELEISITSKKSKASVMHKSFEELFQDTNDLILFENFLNDLDKSMGGNRSLGRSNRDKSNSDNNNNQAPDNDDGDAAEKHRLSKLRWFKQISVDKFLSDNGNSNTPMMKPKRNHTDGSIQDRSSRRGRRKRSARRRSSIGMKKSIMSSDLQQLTSAIMSILSKDFAMKKDAGAACSSSKDVNLNNSSKEAGENENKKNNNIHIKDENASMDDDNVTVEIQFHHDIDELSLQLRNIGEMDDTYSYDGLRLKQYEQELADEIRKVSIHAVERLMNEDSHSYDDEDEDDEFYNDGDDYDEYDDAFGDGLGRPATRQIECVVVEEVDDDDEDDNDETEVAGNTASNTTARRKNNCSIPEKKPRRIKKITWKGFVKFIKTVNAAVVNWTIRMFVHRAKNPLPQITNS